MPSQLKLGALLSYVVLGLNNLVGLLYTPYLLRMLGKSEYGMYSIVASVVAYLTILDLGFGNAIVRYTAKYRAEGKAEEQNKMFGMFFLLYCGISLVAVALGFVLAFNTDLIFDGAMTAWELSRVRVMLFLMVLNLAVTFPFSLFGSIVTAYERFVFQKLVAIFRILLNTGTMIVLLQFGYKAVALVVVTTIFNLYTLASNFFYCKKFLNIRMAFGKIDWSFLKEVAVYSFWIFLNAIMDRIYWSTGQFVLGAFVGTAAVAVFAVAIQLEHMYMSFSTAISGVFLPKVTAMVSRSSSEKAVSDLFIRTGRVQYCVLALVLSGFFLFGRQFIEFWAGPGYRDAYGIALLFFVPLTVPLIQNLGITILQARNQMKFRSLLYLGISLVSLALQIPLARHYGGFGCAFAIAGALILGQIIVMNVYYQVKQKIDIVAFWKEIFKMSIAPCLLVVVSYFALRKVSLDSPLLLGLGIVVYLLVYLPLFYFASMNAYERDLVMKPVRKILKKNLDLAKKYIYIKFELVVRSWFTLIGGQTVPPFFVEMENLKKSLSVFVDESGDFGAYASHTPYYIVSIILHDQSKNICECVSKLNSKIKSLGYESDFVIHTAPLIRRESIFSQDPPNKRRSLFSSLFFFTQRAPVQYKTFVFEKKQEDDTFALKGRIAKEISLFLRANLSFFQSFQEVILYYDNGQHELNRILNSVFSTELSSYSYRKVLPKDYKLFQSADLICTLKLLMLKCKFGKLSRSEELMFHSIRDLRKQFIKPIERKKFFLCLSPSLTVLPALPVRMFAPAMRFR